MKFMQRNANKAPSTPDHPSAKRQKQHEDSPKQFEKNVLADEHAIRAAISKEERGRAAAIERAAEQAGDSHWVLSYPNQEENEAVRQKTRRVVYVGYAEIDSPLSHIPGTDTEYVSPMALGRRTYGKVEKPGEPSSSESEDSVSEDGSTEDDPTGVNAMTRAKGNEHKKADKAESKPLARVRERKEVRLSTLTSISGSSSPMDARSRKRKASEYGDRRPDESQEWGK